MGEQSEQAGGSRGVVRGLRSATALPRAGHLVAALRMHFDLPVEAVVTVSELLCRVPGCPPVETVALIWDARGVLHRLKIFRPLADVVEADFPPRWYLPALMDEGEPDCSCC